MTPVLVLAIGVLGGLGAVGRFLLDGAVARRFPGAFPFGTLAVNLLGSVALGALAGAGVDGSAYAVVGTGLVAAFTTFSTWAFESHRLGEDGRLGLAALNFAFSLLLGLAAIWLGRELGSLL